MSEPEVPAEIDEALRRQGLMARRFVLISPPDAHKRGRFSYRVEVEGGPPLKARRFESDEAARANFELRSGLDEAFASAIAWHGPVLLEAWIDGVPLEELAAEARVEEAGAVLGRLHAQALTTPTPAAGTAAWRDRAAVQLQVLASGGMLAPHEVARLGDELSRHDPGTASVRLVHRDFCAANMVIDARGRLRVIDNEWMAIEPAGFDLGRTFCRWPMSEGAWERFLGAYRSMAPCATGPLAFWKIVAALFGAQIRLGQGPERLAVPLGQLRRMARLPDAALRDSS